MIGIEAIACYVPETKLSNYEVREKFEIEENFLDEKLGIVSLARMSVGQETSDLGVAAVEKLFAITGIDHEAIECLVVVTQNPDGYGLPHTSSIIHNKLALPTSCASFDVSLGCSGYVYGLSVVSSFMAANGMGKGLLVTCDPYSKIVDPDDRDTAIIFGDGASATLLSNTPVWRGMAFDFGTRSDLWSALHVGESRKLRMNGRAIFNFAAMEVPKSINRVLEKLEFTADDIDEIVLHQGSKYIVDTIAKRLKMPDKVEFYARDYGNLVSSSIPAILAEKKFSGVGRIVVSGFGVGLSWATAVMEKADAE